MDFGEILETMPGLTPGVALPRKDNTCEKFKCRKCGNRISYNIKDRELFESLGWECSDCHITIANKRYEVNIKGGVTVFSPMGAALGDQIIQEVVRRRYVADNPDERVIFLDEWSNNIFDIYQPNKVFWANLHSGGLMKPEAAIWFSLCNEVNEFARQGYYSQFPYRLSNSEYENFRLFKGSVVFHLRNIDKVREKNIEPIYVLTVLNVLKGLKVRKVVFVGNDQVTDGLDLRTINFNLGNGLQIFDYRNQLTLNQIAFLCHHARLFVGKDSGIAHLAGAAGCRNIVVWGYQNYRYFPKVAPGVCTAWTREETKILEIEDEVRKRVLGSRFKGSEV